MRSFGVGRDEQELSRLEEHARQFISEQEGFVGGLFAETDDVLLEDFLSTINNAGIQVIGPELIFGQLYDRIGYGAIRSDLFRHLVVSRLFSPGSKLKAIDYLERYQGISYSKDTILQNQNSQNGRPTAGTIRYGRPMGCPKIIWVSHCEKQEKYSWI